MSRGPSCGHFMNIMIIFHQNGGGGLDTGKKTLTDSIHKGVEGSIREERLRKLPEEHLKSSSGDMDVLPLTVIQIHRLV